MLRYITCFALMFCTLPTFAQNYTLKGKVQNSESLRIAAAVVSLLKVQDSSLAGTAYTEDNGSFTIDNIAAGSYIIRVTALNYTPVFQSVSLDGNKTVTITLQKKSNALQEVTVTSKKPYIQTDLGKTIVNVDASILTAGTNVLELLRKSPGVTVDANGNISLEGKKGVLVLLDGRDTYLSGEELSDYLKTLSSDQVAQLELITQPSAKYDAAGVAGIINIKTKKNNKSGFNGTATATYTQGVYALTEQNILLNYKHQKLNLSASFSQLNATGWQRANKNTVFKDPVTQVPVSTATEQAFAKEIFANTQLKLGADYSLTDKVTLGGSVTGIYHPNHEVSTSTTSINTLATNNATYSTAYTPDHFLRNRLLANSYLNYDFSKHTQMTIDANYLGYDRKFYQSSDNKDFDQNNNLTDELYLRSYMPSTINVYNIKDDITTITSDHTKLEFGFKCSYTMVNDSAGYSLLQNNLWIPDTTRSNHYIYNENTNALYVNTHRTFDKRWEAQAGLRVEQTYIAGRQLEGNLQFSSNRISLFPTAFVSYKLNDKNSFEANFGRRIERPYYQSLNPFIDFIDQYNYRAGNPTLRPEYSYYTELKYNYNNELITAVQLTQTTGMINDVIRTNNVTNVSVKTENNGATSSRAGVSVTYSKQPFKWLQLSVNGNIYYASFTDSNASKLITLNGTGDYVNVDTQITLGNGWTAEGQYYVVGKSAESTTATARTTQSMDFGVAKKMMHDTATVKLNISDPFNINGYSEQYTSNSFDALYSFKWHTRSCGMTFTYKFGQKYDSKQHNADMGDDARRM